MCKLIFIFIIIVFITFITFINFNKTNESFSNELNNDNLNVYIINLDKDKDRLKYIKNVLSNIFNKENIIRIPGVLYNNSIDGCRLAHIKANEKGIKDNNKYYLICEDDLKPLLNYAEIKKHINDCIKSDIDFDLVLFEIAGRKGKFEKKMKLKKVTDNMYRIYRGNWGAACYLCKTEFGKNLINHWKNRPNKHCDITWQELWKDYAVYFYRPQLFIQKEGESNQDDVVYRDDIVPFNWKLFENYNK